MSLLRYACNQVRLRESAAGNAEPGEWDSVWVAYHVYRSPKKAERYVTFHKSRAGCEYGMKEAAADATGQSGCFIGQVYSNAGYFTSMDYAGSAAIHAAVNPNGYSWIGFLAALAAEFLQQYFATLAGASSLALDADTDTTEVARDAAQWVRLRATLGTTAPRVSSKALVPPTDQAVAWAAVIPRPDAPVLAGVQLAQAASALDQIPYSKMKASGNTGHGVKVAVLDCGFRPVDDRGGGGPVTCVSAVPSYDSGYGTNPHGEWVTTCVRGSKRVPGIAPDVTLLQVRVGTDDGWGQEDWMTAGLEVALQWGAQVINLSMAGDGAMPDFQEQLQAAEQMGVVVLMAAGNGGPAAVSPSYPAAYSPDRAVGALSPTPGYPYSSFSQHEATNALCQMGEQCLVDDGNGSVTQQAGTSFATPYTTGAVAALLSGLDAFKAGGWSPGFYDQKFWPDRLEKSAVTGIPQLSGGRIKTDPDAMFAAVVKASTPPPVVPPPPAVPPTVPPTVPPPTPIGPTPTRVLKIHPADAPVLADLLIAMGGLLKAGPGFAVLIDDA